MKFIFYKTFRFRLISAFLSVFSVAILLFFGYKYFNNQKLDHENLSSQIANLKSQIINTTSSFQSFLLYGYKSKLFYDTKKEANIDGYINQIRIQKQQLEPLLVDLRMMSENEQFIGLIDELKHDFILLQSSANTIKRKQLELGYRDYGTIGSMREIAHIIEDSNLINNEEILSLRRFEKDFLLRTDSSYLSDFNRYCDILILKYYKNKKVEDALLKYKYLFNKVVELYYEIGKTSNIGLYDKIVRLNVTILDKFNTIQDLSNIEITKKNSDINKYVIISIVAMFGILAILMFYFSIRLATDLERLKFSINRFIKSGFKDNKNTTLNDKSNILEVDFLFKAYNHLKENLLQNIDGLNMTIEELERTASYKSSFLANMSHEIRTPLNGVISAVNLLNQTELNKDQKELLEIADFSSSHLLGLINLILDYSKISAGKMTLENRAIDLQDDLSKLIKIFKFQATEKGIDLFYDFKKSGEASRFVYGDTVRIHQVIINLLNNAIKFTQKGWVRFTIEQKEIDGEFDKLKFSIEDTGVGIKDDKVNKIFQAFEQEDLSTTRKYGGTGLGLTISNDLVRLMNGELRFKPSAEKGSCFYFTLKLKRANKLTRDANGIGLLNKLPRLDKTINALVVDDNIMNQKVLGMMLKKFNIHIDYANNGLEAIDQYKIYDYDMIFMDIQMPLLDGLNATERIKKTSKFMNNPIPIIAVSASTYSDDKKAAQNVGISDFISKPIEVKKLHDLLIKYSLKL